MDLNDDIEALVSRLENAWNDGDGTAYADAFAEDADFIHILGGYGQGRPAIAGAHSSLFSTIYKDSRVSYRIDAVRPLSADVCAVRLHQTLDYQDGGKPVTMQCRPTAVVVRNAGAWRIALMQNTRVVEVGENLARSNLARHPFAPA